MAVPKRKTSKSKNRKRHSHDALEPINLSYDDQGNLHMSHRATFSKQTGEYRYKGRVVYKLPVKGSQNEA